MDSDGNERTSRATATLAASGGEVLVVRGAERAPRGLEQPGSSSPGASIRRRVLALLATGALVTGCASSAGTTSPADEPIADDAPEPVPQESWDDDPDAVGWDRWSVPFGATSAAAFGPAIIVDGDSPTRSTAEELVLYAVTDRGLVERAFTVGVPDEAEVARGQRVHGVEQAPDAPPVAVVLAAIERGSSGFNEATRELQLTMITADYTVEPRDVAVQGFGDWAVSAVTLGRGQVFAIVREIPDDRMSPSHREQRLVAIDPADGTIRWDHEIGGYIGGDPLLGEVHDVVWAAGVVIARVGADLVAFEPETGQHRWTLEAADYPALSGFIRLHPVVASPHVGSEVVTAGSNLVDARTGELLYIAGGSHSYDHDQGLLAVENQDHDGGWHATTPVDGHTFHVVDRDSGDDVFTLDAARVEALGGIVRPFGAAVGHVWVQTGRSLTIVDARTGDRADISPPAGYGRSLLAPYATGPNWTLLAHFGWPDGNMAGSNGRWNDDGATLVLHPGEPFDVGHYMELADHDT